MKKVGKGRLWRRVSVWFFTALLVSLVIGTTLLWQQRVKLVSRLVDQTLTTHDIDDLTYRITRLTPWRLTLKDVVWGDPEKPLLQIQCLEAHFTPEELRYQHLERLHLQGVRLSATLQDGTVILPLHERIKREVAKYQSRQKQKPTDPERGATDFSLWMATIRDLSLTIECATNATPIAALNLNLGAVAEESNRYRLWGQSRATYKGTPLADALVSGAISPTDATIALQPTIEINDLTTALELAQTILPTWQPPPLTAHDCSLSLSGELSTHAWTQLKPFKLTLALGRNALFTLPQESLALRLQTLRCELSGTPTDLHAQLNAGIADLSLPGDTSPTPRTQGRLLTLRSSAHYQDLSTNRTLSVTLDSDLPGRSVATFLPRILPVVPVFFSDGGALRLEADLTAPTNSNWQGNLQLTANAQRSSLPMPDMHLGAGLVRISSSVAIANSQLGAIDSTITLQNGYCFKNGAIFKGNFESTLNAAPPYDSAAGNFQADLDATALLGTTNITWGSGSLPLTGTVRVSNLLTNPLWQVNAQLPELPLTTTTNSQHLDLTLGATAEVRYTEGTVAAHAQGWLHNLALRSHHHASDTPPNAAATTASLKQLLVELELPTTATTNFITATLAADLKLSGGELTIPEVAQLRGAQMETALNWSVAEGITFQPAQLLTWESLQAFEMEVLPQHAHWSATGDNITAALSLQLAESALSANILAQIPLSDPRAITIAIEVPEVAIAEDDSLVQLATKYVAELEASATLAATANLRFLGSQPHVTGRLQLREGCGTLDKFSIAGLALEVPFINGVIFRTIEKPSLSFKKLSVGDIHLDHGQVDFQVTKRGLFVEAADVGMCEGFLRAYAIAWDFKNPQSDFVVYFDRIDLGEALMMAVPFEGKMEGVLYGRMPVKINRSGVKLSTGYLYSLPGQGGKLRMDSNRQMQELLDNSGIRGEMQEPLSKALSNMDFSTLRFELEPRENGEGTLRIKLVGKSNDKEWPAPVDLNLNLHGQLEKLINIGLDMLRKNK